MKLLLKQENILGWLCPSERMIGWLWFAIGGSRVSDRLPRPWASKHIIREEMSCKREGKLFWIKITRLI